MIDFDDIVDQPWRLWTDEVKGLCGLALKAVRSFARRLIFSRRWKPFWPRFKSGPELCSTVVQTPQHWLVLVPCRPRLNLQKLDNKIINEVSNNEIKWQSNVINIGRFKIKFDLRSFISSKTFWGVNFIFLWITSFRWIMFVQSRMIIHSFEKNQNVRALF